MCFRLFKTKDFPKILFVFFLTIFKTQSMFLYFSIHLHRKLEDNCVKKYKTSTKTTANTFLILHLLFIFYFFIFFFFFTFFFLFNLPYSKLKVFVYSQYASWTTGGQLCIEQFIILQMQLQKHFFLACNCNLLVIIF